MSNKTDSLSIIDSGLIIEGNVHSVGKLIIKGTLKGNLEGETIIISKEGKVLADLNVGDITVGGFFDGNLNVSGILKVLSTGQCVGKICCRDMVVENGSILNANVDCTSNDNAHNKVLQLTEK
ncbi:Protein containing DUF583 [Candidatus Magnetomoraceae bacterium gMMP-1]